MMNLRVTHRLLKAVTTKAKRLTSSQVGVKYGFRSGLEKSNAALLQQTGTPYSYESEKIVYTKPERVSKYTPDFIIDHRPDGTKRNKRLIVETKGRFLLADRQKHLLIKQQHPELDIRFVFNNPNARISKGAKTTYRSWCEKHGFLFAKDRIPQSWLEEL